MLYDLSKQIEQQRIEFNQAGYHQTFTKSMSMLNRRSVDQAIAEMEAVNSCLNILFAQP
ncbi:hypothetical protein [Photorhabdus asymbiotica]